MSKFNLKKYFLRQSCWVTSLDLLTMTMNKSTLARKFRTISYFKGFVRRSKNIIEGLDAEGEQIPLSLLVNYENDAEVESVLFSTSPVGSEITYSRLETRIREIEYLMSIGRVPPEGTWIYHYKGMFEGKKGVVVTPPSNKGKLVVRYYDTHESYMLEGGLDNCRLLSGHILGMSTPDKVELFKSKRDNT